MEKLKTRVEIFKELFPSEPKFRVKQINEGLFNFKNNCFDDLLNFKKEQREEMKKSLSFMTVKKASIFQSKHQDTYKAIVKGVDGQRFETVLMENKKGAYTICVSSQIGCAMKCNFCATGMMGFKRNLLSDEIVDQYRFWRYFLLTENIDKRISNIVFMGMGEPMANYQNVKDAINTILDNTDLGPTKITVSSVGILPMLTKSLTDLSWPNVRIAISLHSADAKRRKEIVPTTQEGFLEKLVVWVNEYHRLKGSKKHHITFEYTLINGVNDSVENAKLLAKYIKQTGNSKINVIPLNPVPGKEYETSHNDRIKVFKETLRKYHLDVTQRKTMGEDIAAACGQLLVK